MWMLNILSFSSYMYIIYLFIYLFFDIFIDSLKAKNLIKIL